MLHIDARTEAGGEKSHDRFGDAVKAQWRMAQTVLRETHGHSQQQAARRVPATQCEIDGYQKREFEVGGPTKVQGKKRLQHERQKDRTGGDAGVKLVDFDVLLIQANFHLTGSLKKARKQTAGGAHR